MQKLFYIVSNFKTHYHLKFDFQKVEPHTWGTCLNHGIKHHEDNQLQSVELPGRIS